MSEKILLVANTDWYLFNFRLSLAKFLKQRGYDVIMVSPSGKFSPEFKKNGFRFIDWPVGRKTLSPIREILSIIRLMRIYNSEKPILVHHFTIKPVLYGSLAAKFSKTASVVNSVTGLGYIFLTPGWKGAIMRFFILPLYRYAFSNLHLHVIFENENDQATFINQRLVPLNSTKVIQGVGVDAEYYQPSKASLNEEPLVVFPARMLYDKGLGTLIGAARILKRKLKLRIALVGDLDPGNPSSVDEKTIKYWEKEGLVEWWGFNEDMLSVYQKSNIVVLPSFGEGLPTVLIEAAACARPIVATDVAGCRDVVIHNVNGLLVPVNQAEPLAKAIETLIHEPQKCILMGDAGRKMVLEKFTDKIINNKTLLVYNELLSSKKI